jgi:hypothetical protein
MAFSRLSNDQCNQKYKYKESTSPGLYQTNTPILCQTCFQENPQMINQHGGVSIKRDTDWRFYTGPVDVESDLMNINNRATNCPDGKFKPKCPKCVAGSGVKNCRCNQNDELVNATECKFPIENTRLSNPPSTLRSTGWNRFDYLCLDPQANLNYDNTFSQGIDTKQLAKDTYKICRRIVKVNSMNP